MIRKMPVIVAFCCGLLSLSQEILWTRLVSFAYLTKPPAFALVLCLYLLGIAFGAWIGRIACARRPHLLRFGGHVLLLSGVADVAAPWLYAWSHAAQGLFVLCVAIVVTAALKSILFPIVHHLGSNASTATKGASFSSVYAANVAGSALGPLLAGLILLEYVALQGSFALIGALTAALGVAALASERRFTMAGAGSVLTCALLLPLLLLLLPNTLTAIMASSIQPGQAIVSMIENRSGIIHARAGGEEGDVIYGNNVYDGRINTDLHRTGNGIHRAYALAAMHPDPKRVLVIGLSGGAWTKVISEFPTLEDVDVVEINPAYLDLIARYPQVSSLLEDRRIRYHIDDGRRWLRLHPDERYDVIVLNSIHHWRSNATNLLSIEFMSLAKRHLKPNGIFYVNSTSSPEVLNTASKAFKHAYRYANFVAASDLDFRGNMQRNRARYFQMRDGDGALFDPLDPSDLQAIQHIYDLPFISLRQARKEAGRDLGIITDDNMLTEYRYGAGFP